MPVATLLSWATVLVELLGGLAVIVGAYIPLASVSMTFVLLVAIFTVHLPYGFRRKEASIPPYRLMQTLCDP